MSKVLLKKILLSVNLPCSKLSSFFIAWLGYTLSLEYTSYDYNKTQNVLESGV